VTIRTILVPTDFSAHAEKAFARAIEFAKAFGARIELVHAYDFSSWGRLAEVVFADRAEEKLRLAATHALQSMVERAKMEGVQVSTHIALGVPSEVIVNRAEETHADLIVMGTRGLSVAKHVLLGSVAARTIERAPCPVTTVAS
jgi:nucleotide-binding universal stress UspA family protein